MSHFILCISSVEFSYSLLKYFSIFPQSYPKSFLKFTPQKSLIFLRFKKIGAIDNGFYMKSVKVSRDETERFFFWKYYIEWYADVDATTTRKKKGKIENLNQCKGWGGGLCKIHPRRRQGLRAADKILRHIGFWGTCVIIRLHVKEGFYNKFPADIRKKEGKYRILGIMSSSAKS